MSKPLPVDVDGADLRHFRLAARRSGLSLEDWVRQAFRQAAHEASERDAAAKLDAVRTAAQHGFPAPDIDRMLAEIDQGHEAPRPG